MLDFLEVEEFVGVRWHRLVGDSASYRRYPEHAVTFDSVRSHLSIFFRGLGGEATVQMAAGGARASRHRLKLRQRLGASEERVEGAVREGGTIALPARLDFFPSTDLNRDLYIWLAAYFAHAECVTSWPDDALRRDVVRLRQARMTTMAVLADCPGLHQTHERLCLALRDARPQRRLPAMEAAVEAAVLGLMGGPVPQGAIWAAIVGDESLVDNLAAPRGYRPFLPVPLWGQAVDVAAQAGYEDREESGGRSEKVGDGRQRKAARRNADQADRNDPLILNRFEKILSLAEMLNLNRAVDDDDEDNARKAADDLDEISLAKHNGKPAVKLKMDLTLAPQAVDATPLIAELTYPEWDHRQGAYHPDHCRVLASVAAEEGEDWRPDADTAARIRQVRRQFEVLRPKHEVLRAQVDGHELDIEALVRSRAELRASGNGTDRVHMSTRKQARDLAAALLVDVSLSTDSWMDNRRVLDVEKEALTVLAHGLAAGDDDHAIFTFTSRKRSWVRVETVKDFDEPMSPLIERRIAALRPGYYTRIGAAIRHAVARLNERPNRQRLLLILTDGKPNDLDHYEGRYGIEDTRRAVMEARRAGICVFGVTIDSEAQEYFPAIFGRGGYAIIGHIGALPAALPAIYRQLAV